MTRNILEELVRNHFTRVLVLSGHAGQSHMAALRLAAQDIVWHHEKESPEKKPRIMVCSDYDFAYELKGKYFSEKDGHAGTIETSKIMAIRPELIKTKGARSFTKLPRFEIVADPERYFPSGVIGDPTLSPKRQNDKRIRHRTSHKTSQRTETLEALTAKTLSRKLQVRGSLDDRAKWTEPNHSREFPPV
jgi:creatinine amidohydrolase